MFELVEVSKQSKQLFELFEEERSFDEDYVPHYRINRLLYNEPAIHHI
jgi:hypothetical protein